MTVTTKNSFVDLDSMAEGFRGFRHASPFDHCVIDDFLDPEFVRSVEKEFLSYDSDKWFVYKNAIEDKKALNDWNAFPPNTYRLFFYLCSPEFVSRLSKLAGLPLFPDVGLNGGGWHIYGPGGTLNPHLDYSIHPKLGLQRKLNLIIYLSHLSEEHGGHLGFWTHDPESKGPGKVGKEIQPKFNRAIFFDTTQNSWHGLSRPLVRRDGVFRKSLAMYYLCEPAPGADRRGRALYAPRPDQEGDRDVEELIRLRAGVDTSSLVYRK